MQLHEMWTGGRCAIDMILTCCVVMFINTCPVILKDRCCPPVQRDGRIYGRGLQGRECVGFDVRERERERGEIGEEREERRVSMVRWVGFHHQTFAFSSFFRVSVKNLVVIMTLVSFQLCFVPAMPVNGIVVLQTISLNKWTYK